MSANIDESSPKAEPHEAAPQEPASPREGRVDEARREIVEETRTVLKRVRKAMKKPATGAAVAGGAAIAAAVVWGAAEAAVGAAAAWVVYRMLKRKSQTPANQQAKEAA